MGGSISCLQSKCPNCLILDSKNEKQLTNDEQSLTKEKLKTNKVSNAKEKIINNNLIYNFKIISNEKFQSNDIQQNTNKFELISNYKNNESNNRNELKNNNDINVYEKQKVKFINNEKAGYLYALNSNEKRIQYWEDFAKNLENSKINFRNIDSSSCYQSSTLQGFVHIIFPTAFRNMISNTNQYRYKNINNIDKLKNNNEYNNIIIDILKDINTLQKNGEGQYGYEAKKLFNKFPPKEEFHQGINNIEDCNILHDALQINSFNPSNLIGASFLIFDNSNNKLAKVINIEQNTIITDVMKIKIEGYFHCHGNLVLKIDDNDLKDNNLNIIKLIRKCPQLSEDIYSKKKIEIISDIVYMIVDRISNGKNIQKQFMINEKIYFDNITKNFSEIHNYKSLEYDLKFIIYHMSYGHYISYCKIGDFWYYFDDLQSDYAKRENPPLMDDKT